MFALYVTGTDTGIGKTLASCALLNALRGHGLRAAGMKPVASGCTRIDGEWRNADALALQAAGEPGIAYADINPFALEHPLAPELAARGAGVEVSLLPILASHARLSDHADAVVIEGVGGWAAPLVVGLRLGCLNHALLSARAIATDGAHLAGWIASHVDPDMERVDDNIEMLRARLPAPCWGVLPHAEHPDPALLASRLRIPMLAE